MKWQLKVAYYVDKFINSIIYIFFVELAFYQFNKIILHLLPFFFFHIFGVIAAAHHPSSLL